MLASIPLALASILCPHDASQDANQESNEFAYPQVSEEQDTHKPHSAVPS